MFNSTDQQKAKYSSLISGVLQSYNGFIQNVNNELVSYGKEFYNFSTGKTTQNYIIDSKNKLMGNLASMGKNQFSQMIDKLNKLKESYINECFPAESTNNPLELDFIGKELSVMTDPELADFYKANLLDKNKVRLFDIEVKRRKMTSSNPELTTLDILRSEYGIEDDVTKDIDAKMKILELYRQMASISLPLFSDINNDVTKPLKTLSCDQLIKFVESNSRHASPQNVDIKDLLNVDYVY